MMKEPLTPNVETARRFLELLEPDGNFSFATYDDAKRASSLARRLDGKLNESMVATLCSLNNEGAAVCVTINRLDGAGRSKENVTAVRAVFVDLDGADVSPVLSAELPPHIIVESSPGRWHAYWLVTGIDLKAFPKIQAALASRFDGDPSVCDLPRVMRLPGFFHQKNEPIEVLLDARATDQPRYSADQIGQFLGVATPTADIIAKPFPPVSGVGEGGRNTFLAQEAGRLRRKGLDTLEIFCALKLINAERCNPELDDHELQRIAVSIGRYPLPEIDKSAFSMTDTGNAERFVAQHGQDVKYVPETGKWILWNNGLWVVDQSGFVIELAKKTAKSIRDEAMSCRSSTDQQALAKYASQSLNKTRLTAMISLASTDSKIVTPLETLDANPMTFGTQNGVVDLTTGTFRSSTREDLLTRKCGTEFDAEASCPTFLTFLERTTGGDEELMTYLQTLSGYVLTGSSQEQCFAFLYGRGANGKSTFVDTLLRLCGDYGSATQPETLMARQGGSASNDIARLVGKRLVVSNEVREGAHLEENLVKQLVGGDVVTARFLFREHFEFRPQFKLLIAGNHMPVIKGDDDGIWRRVHLVPFVHTVPPAERDKTLGAKLAGELPGILNWAIEGCIRWQSKGLCPPRVVVDASSKYRDEMDLMKAWIDENCIVNPAASSSSNRIFENYRQWAEASGIKPLTRLVFIRKMESRGYLRKHRRDGNYLMGISVDKALLLAA